MVTKKEFENKEKGFDSYSKYREYLVKEKGFESSCC